MAKKRKREPPQTSRRRAHEKYTPAQIITALEASAGIRIGAARILHCSRSTISNYVDRYPEVKEALEEIMENRLDIAEGVIIARMGDNSNPAVQANCAQFYLKLKGRERGYGASERPLRISVPAIDTAADIPAAMAEVFARVTAGDITPDEGKQLTDLLELRRRALVEIDIEARLLEVERATQRGATARH